MTPQCSIRLDSFKNNFFSGFMKLQHDEEFVDMTLAAEGHLVKVHKNILALASPYIKEVLQTAPCPHPVIFLTQTKKEILGYILEYVYTGEVQVPNIRMGSFIDAAKVLRIIGFENVISPMYSASYQSEVLKTISERNTTEQKTFHSISKVSDSTTEICAMQPILTYLPEHITTVDSMNEHNNKIQNNNVIPQTSQTIQSCEQFHNMESSNTSGTIMEEVHNENCTNAPREIKIDLDTIVHTLQSENLKSNIDVNNVTTAIATYNDIQIPEDIWSEDHKANMDYKSPQARNVEQNENVCPGTSNDDEHKLKNVIVTTLDSNQTTLFDFEAVVNSAVTSVDAFCKNSQQSTYNNSFTEKEMETNGTGEALLGPVVPNNDQHFSFEISASSVQNSTGKPMTITINPMEWEPGHNTETKNTTLTHDCSSPLYTVSKRGRLMLILNRYMYNLHHLSKRKRRWRCVDYYCRGKQSCKAYVDTENDMVTSRKFMHDHPFHDKKILNKGHAGNIYTSVKDASIQIDNMNL